MSEGSKRRPQQASEEEMAERWAITFDDKNNRTVIHTLFTIPGDDLRDYLDKHRGEISQVLRDADE